MSRMDLSRGTSALGRYLVEIRSSSRPDREGESAAGRGRSSGGRVAIEKLVLPHLGFVVKIAREYRHMGVPLEDLINEGNIGLCLAASRFDPSRGTPFVTYAGWWVRKRILEAIARQGWPVRLPDHQRRKEALARLGRSGQDAGTAGPAGGRRWVSIDARPEEGPARGADLPADHDAPDPEGRAIREELRERLGRALGLQPRRERQVIVWRYGLLDGFPRSLREIGNALGLSRERIRQIESSAQERLRVPVMRPGPCALETHPAA